MRYLIKFIFYIVLSCVGMFLYTSYVDAAEQQVNLTVTAPTTRVDGTVLNFNEISEYRIYTGINTSVAVPSIDYVSVIPGTDIIYKINLNPSDTPYTIEFATTAVDLNNRESGPSNIITKIITVNSDSPPASPTVIDVVISCLVGCEVTVQ